MSQGAYLDPDQRHSGDLNPRGHAVTDSFTLPLCGSPGGPLPFITHLATVNLERCEADVDGLPSTGKPFETRPIRNNRGRPDAPDRTPRRKHKRCGAFLQKSLAVGTPLKLVVFYRDHICWTVVCPRDSDLSGPLGITNCSHLSVEYDLAVRELRIGKCPMNLVVSARQFVQGLHITLDAQTGTRMMRGSSMRADGARCEMRRQLLERTTGTAATTSVDCCGDAALKCGTVHRSSYHGP
jgi:hypothetical protein